jgi:hypothetical protein
MYNHPYPQFSSNTLQLLPGFVPPPLLTIPQQKPLHYQNENSQKMTLLLAQPVSNPNNNPTQPLNNVEMQAFPTYVITPVPLQEIQLRSKKVLDRQRPSVVIKEEEEETTQQPMEDTRWEDVIIPKNQEPKLPQNEPSQITKVPPYPNQLVIEKPTTRWEFDILNELKNICVKIPLLQAIKDIHGNPGNPIVTKTIKEVSIRNTLIDLGEAINVMTATTLEQLQLEPLLWPTPTILELADKTRVISEGILDDDMVTLDSWEYPTYFFVIHSKDIASRPSHYFGNILASHNECIYWL